MDTKHLESFVAVARHGQINVAAQELHLSQPALSRQMSALEAEVGARLFQRHARGMRLTAAGERFRVGVADLLLRLSSLLDEVRAEGEVGRAVRVGLPPGLPHDWFRERLGSLETTTLSLFEAPTDEQRAMLERGELDITVTHLRNPTCESRLVLTQELGAAVRPGTPLADLLAQGRGATLQDLRGLRVMAHSRGEIRVQEAMLKNAMKQSGVQAEWVFRKFGQHSELIADLARADVALTTQASARLNFPSWVWIPLHDKDAAGEDLVVSTWVSWQPRPAEEVAQVVGLLVGAEVSR